MSRAAYCSIRVLATGAAPLMIQRSDVASWIAGSRTANMYCNITGTINVDVLRTSRITYQENRGWNAMRTTTAPPE